MTETLGCGKSTAMLHKPAYSYGMIDNNALHHLL